MRFRLNLAHGTCVGVALPPFKTLSAIALDQEGLHPNECDIARTLPPLQRATYVGGRLALREALTLAGWSGTGPILSRNCGAPELPTGFSGSISHKLLGDAALAVGLAAREECASLGVDIEPLIPERLSLAPQVLTKIELDDLSRIPAARRWPEVIARFTVKEAIFKACDPNISGTLSFHDVSVRCETDGRVSLDWTGALPMEPGTIEARWVQIHGFLISSARYAPQDSKSTVSRVKHNSIYS